MLMRGGSGGRGFVSCLQRLRSPKCVDVFRAEEIPSPFGGYRAIPEVNHARSRGRFALSFALNCRMLGQADGLCLGLTCGFPVAKLLTLLSISLPFTYLGSTSQIPNFKRYSVSFEISDCHQCGGKRWVYSGKADVPSCT